MPRFDGLGQLRELPAAEFAGAEFADAEGWQTDPTFRASSPRRAPAAGRPAAGSVNRSVDGNRLSLPGRASEPAGPGPRTRLYAFECNGVLPRNMIPSRHTLLALRGALCDLVTVTVRCGQNCQAVACRAYRVRRCLRPSHWYGPNTRQTDSEQSKTHWQTVAFQAEIKPPPPAGGGGVSNSRVLNPAVGKQRSRDRPPDRNPCNSYAPRC